MMGGWGNMMGAGWGTGGYGYGGYGMMEIIMPLIIGIGIVLLVICLFRHNSSKAYTSKLGGENTALDILRERYARGEIDSMEFKSKMHDLKGI